MRFHADLLVLVVLCGSLVVQGVETNQTITLPRPSSGNNVLRNVNLENGVKISSNVLQHLNVTNNTHVPPSVMSGMCMVQSSC